MSDLIWLNECNGADKVEREYFGRTLATFHNDYPLYGVVMGVAYGGSLQAMGKEWKNKGHIYGYDTFEDLHPKHLIKDQEDREATCMDHWYQDNINGTEGLSKQAVRDGLDAHHIENVTLVKGEVHKDSCKILPGIHYAFLDMDLLPSMKTGYQAVKDKIVKGGYLLMHDVVAKNNLPRLHEWFFEDVILKDWDMWQILDIQQKGHIAALQKK